ncbi:MAG: phospholipid carrier-dependent glycosyltransferase [Candidatus Woesearchaeota archaeon]
MSRAKLFLSFFLLYVVFAGFNGWNEKTRILVAASIVLEKNFDIDEYYHLTGDRSYFNGHYYSDKSIGTSLYLVPFFYVIKVAVGHEQFAAMVKNDNYSLLLVFLSVVVCSALFGALSVLLCYECLLIFQAKEKNALIISLLFGLGTLVFIYSRLFFGHIIAMYFAFLSFYLLLKSEKNKKDGYLFFAGLAGGLSILMDYISMAVIGFVLIFVFFRFFHKAWRFCLGLCVFLLVVLAYNHTVFGGPFKQGHMFLDREVWNNITFATSSTQMTASNESGPILQQVYSSQPNSTRLAPMQRQNLRLLFCQVHFKKATNDTLFCTQEFSENPDFLNYCYSLVLMNTEYCYNISDLKIKDACLGLIAEHTGREEYLSNITSTEIKVYYSQTINFISNTTTCLAAFSTLMPMQDAFTTCRTMSYPIIESYIVRGGECSSLKVPTQLAFCKAYASGNPNNCNSLPVDTLKKFCIASLKKDPDYCLLKNDTSEKIISRVNFFIYVRTILNRLEFSAIFQQLFLPYRGLFFYYPFLIFSFLGLFLMLKKPYKAEALLIILSFAVIVIVYSSTTLMWWGGAAFGPRHLTIMMPFFMIPLHFAVEKFGWRLVAPIAWFSIIVNFAAMQPPEQIITYGDGIVIKPEYRNQIHTFSIIANPLLEYYFPLLFTKGPQSILLEKITGMNFPPFLNLFVVFIALFALWWSEIKSRIIFRRHKKISVAKRRFVKPNHKKRVIKARKRKGVK